jgi:uncharacterized protein (TIGR00106 family)
MLLAEFSMWPMDKGESVGPYVARLLDIIDKSGLQYRLGPLGTCVEGEFDAVMSVIKKCHEALAADCNRIACTIKMDYRKGHDNMLESKVASVEKRVGRKLKT